MKNIIFLVFLGILLVAQGRNAWAQDDMSKRKEHFYLENGVALQGYDPVSYFDSQPQKGNQAWQYTYKGISYLFANQVNLDKFKANPTQYEPAYGGWCAYAIGSYAGKTKVNPTCYKIDENGKLLLFYNKNGFSALEGWLKDEKNLADKAIENWKKINNK
jgi:YHS domain-containing protein